MCSARPRARSIGREEGGGGERGEGGEGGKRKKGKGERVEAPPQHRGTAMLAVVQGALACAAGVAVAPPLNLAMKLLTCDLSVSELMSMCRYCLARALSLL